MTTLCPWIRKRIWSTFRCRTSMAIPSCASWRPLETADCGEEAAHLGFDQDAKQNPTHQVQTGGSARHRRIVRGGQKQSEDQDVRRKNPEQRQAAQGIERVDALSLRDWRERLDWCHETGDRQLCWSVC